MLRIAHIVNPFKAPRSSDLYTAQPITFESMLRAREKARGKVAVELLTAQFKEDRDLIPSGFRASKDLSRSVLDVETFRKPVELPLLHDILERLFCESEAEYLIYTNVDIGLYPDFYLKVGDFIAQGLDAFIINRRRLEARYDKVSDLEAIYADKGQKHPGFDCFVFHRDLFPKMRLEGICIGVPFIEISLSQNLFALAKNFKLFEEEVLTFHIGMEIFKRRMPREYFWYNRKEFHKIEEKLLPLMRLEKFPFSEYSFPERLLKWGLHPCIPFRLVVKLLLRRGA